MLGRLITLMSGVCCFGSVLAGPAADSAQKHFEAIASGDVAAIMSAYGPSSQLNWIGGPLDGMYSGTDGIRPVWEKFAKASAPLKLSVSNVEESANPKGATVSANVQLEGRQTLRVRYILTYRDGVLVSETWQVDPKLAVSAAY